ncbi:glycine betaine/L-proline transport ATP binding subunit [Helcococcus kunzii ATCC 51366]|uniref:Quaternary amine transport ATP-binding protein n=1 Tax=Helcococcus kunzii ATCC 51366 TaxID=883114 RepID=H3NP73_9FIRM|nr:ABC transporter ATP-binding protein [Helcococcus kunzii]EHR33535.1 glycine betaine/L-proline transport ATP binding subunit [Helcococcus kunzii ATCC 51366]
MIKIIEFQNVTKKYSKDVTAVDGISMKINKGEFICLVGTSGSGKTTLMRMINRMNVPTNGKVLINGKDISKENPVKLRRSIGYVIQQIGLLPHMTIFENVAIVPRMLKWPESKIKDRVESLAEKASLDKDYLNFYPSELSGGQQQRVGVIRALAADQEIILMDEPFGALDPITRESLQKFTKNLQKELGKTIVFVTHDMDEAIALSDKIAIMDKGKLIQFDTPKNILTNPASEFVSDLLGEERIKQSKFNFQSIDNIMMKNPITVTKDTTLREAADIMKTKRVDTLFVVTEDMKLLGLINIFNLQRHTDPNKLVGDIMEEAFYLPTHTLVRDVIYYIQKLGYRNIPVLEGDKLVGLITRSTIVDFIYSGYWEGYTPENDILEEHKADKSKDGEVDEVDIR